MVRRDAAATPARKPDLYSIDSDHSIEITIKQTRQIKANR